MSADKSPHSNIRKAGVCCTYIITRFTSPFFVYGAQYATTPESINSQKSENQSRNTWTYTQFQSDPRSRTVFSSSIIKDLGWFRPFKTFTNSAIPQLKLDLLPGTAVLPSSANIVFVRNPGAQFRTSLKIESAAPVHHFVAGNSILNPLPLEASQARAESRNMPECTCYCRPLADTKVC